MAEPAPTRRSSRNRDAVPATISESADATLLPASDRPLSRRAARESLRAVRPAAAEDAPSPAAEDPFTLASQAFRVAGHEPADLRIRIGDVPAAESDSATTSSVGAVTPASTGDRRRPKRRFLAAGATVGVMGIAGLLTVSMTLPAEAVAAARGSVAQATTSLVDIADASAAAEVPEDQIQAFVASSDVKNDSIQRAEDFSTISLLDVAAEQGIRYSDSLYTNDPDAAIQWPFVVGVGMSSGYGMRNGRMHEGLDLVPGAGAPVQAIADGTVRIATESGGAYGVTVYIDHVIDGQVITSHYSHMQYGSLQVKPGDTVTVGTIIGKVGNTGRSYGAHMHFEIIVNGSTIDPLPWMQKNAGRYDGVTSPVS